MRQPILLTINEVAQMLSISRQSVYRLFWSKALPFVKLGSAVRIHRDDLEEYIYSCRKVSR